MRLVSELDATAAEANSSQRAHAILSPWRIVPMIRVRVVGYLTGLTLQLRLPAYELGKLHMRWRSANDAADFAGGSGAAEVVLDRRGRRTPNVWQWKLTDLVAASLIAAAGPTSWHGG